MCLIGITGLSGESTLVSPLTVLEQQCVVVLKITRCRGHIGRLNCVGQIGLDAAEGLVFDALLHNECHIVCTGVVVRIWQTVCIDKMGIRATKCSGAFVHHGGETFLASGNVDGKLCADLICRGKKNRVKSILHCDRFAKLNVDAGISRNGFADSMLAEGNGVGHLLVFNDQQSRQNLGDAGRIALLVHVFIV